MTEAEQNVAAATTGAEEGKHDVEYASEETKNAVSTLKRERGVECLAKAIDNWSESKKWISNSARHHISSLRDLDALFYLKDSYCYHFQSTDA